MPHLSLSSRTLFLRFLTKVATVLFFLSGSAFAADPLSISIEGVEDDLRENVRIALQPPAGLIREDKVNSMWLSRFRKGMPEKVRRALEPFGYYQAEVDVRQEKIGEGQYHLKVLIEPGQPVRVQNLSLQIEGYRHRRLVSALGNFPLQPGDPLRHDLYEKAKAELRSLATSLGYLDASFPVRRIEVDRDAGTADIALALDTNERYFFGDLRISGAPDYPERFLRRYLTVRPGEVFGYDKLGQTQQQFLDSDRFRNVIINPRKDEAQDNRVPVDIQLVPSARRTLRPGIGYGTDTGARFSLRYNDVNVFQLGHEFSVDALLAELQQNIKTAYILPSYSNVDSMTALRAGYLFEDLDTYETEYFYGEFEKIYGLGKGRLASFFVRYQEEDSNVGGEDVSSSFLMPGLRYSQVRFNDPIRPQKGYRFRIETRGTYTGLGSDITVGQILADANLLIPFPWRLFLHLRGNAGFSIQDEDFQDLPASLRFFTGGDRTVRGYAYQSLGPENDEGDTVGGKHLLVGSVEIEKRTRGNWAVAVFYDTGNAFNSFSDYDLADAAGGGVRYYSPVGPIRVDLARTVNEPSPSWRLHVGIGLGW